MNENGSPSLLCGWIVLAVVNLVLAAAVFLQLAF